MRRFLYNLGRLSFYVLLGVVAGASGAVLTKLAGANIALMILRVLASLLVIALGLNLLLNIRTLAFLEKSGAVIWSRLSPFAKHVLPVTTPARALGAGFIWGALPCGLVYSIVAIAAATGSWDTGAAVMLAFWVGTLPSLLVAGASARKLAKLSGRASFRRLAGASLLIVGGFALIMPFVHDTGSAGTHEHMATANSIHGGSTVATNYSQRNLDH